jgi:hypothetical protein
MKCGEVEYTNVIPMIGEDSNSHSSRTEKKVI